jgi:hypothetical protein
MNFQLIDRSGTKKTENFPGLIERSRAIQPEEEPETKPDTAVKKKAGRPKKQDTPPTDAVVKPTVRNTTLKKRREVI